MYLTYDEYTEYGGTLEEIIFDDFCFEAQSYIDWLTYNRLASDTTYPEKVKRCMYALIGIIQSKRITLNTSTDESTVYSISNDGVEQRFSRMDSNVLFNKIKNEVKDTIKRYLSGVKNSDDKLLLYRGLYADE